MPAPSLRSLGTAQAGTTSTPSFAEPAGAASTDIIVIGFFLDGATTVSVVPTGFAAPVDAPQVNTGGAQHSLQVYWGRRADVGAGPYGFTVSASVHVEGRAAAIQDAATSGDPFEDTAGNVDTGLVNTAPSVSATSTGVDRYAFYMATNWSGGAWTPPSGFAEQWDANNQILTFDDKSLPTAQTVTPQAVCAGTDRMTAWVGILLPVSAPPIAVHPPKLPPHLLYRLAARNQAMWQNSPAAGTPQTGAATAGLTGSAAAVRVASTAGAATLGVAGSGATRRTASPTGTSPAALAARGTERKTATTAGTAATGLTGTAADRKTAAPGGTAALGPTGRGADVKTARPPGTTTAAPAGSGADRRTALTAGRATVALTGYGAEAPPGSIPGRATFAAIGHGAPTRTANTTGRAVLAASGYGAHTLGAPTVIHAGIEATTKSSTEDHAGRGAPSLDTAASATTHDATLTASGITE